MRDLVARTRARSSGGASSSTRFGCTRANAVTDAASICAAHAKYAPTSAA
jgi:hypothetical protein